MSYLSSLYLFPLSPSPLMRQIPRMSRAPRTGESRGQAVRRWKPRTSRASTATSVVERLWRRGVHRQRPRRSCLRRSPSPLCGTTSIARASEPIDRRGRKREGAPPPPLLAMRWRCRYLSRAPPSAHPLRRPELRPPPSSTPPPPLLLSDREMDVPLLVSSSACRPSPLPATVLDREMEVKEGEERERERILEERDREVRGKREGERRTGGAR